MQANAAAVREIRPVQPDPMEVFAPVRPLEVRSLAGPALQAHVPAGQRLAQQGRVIGTFFVIRCGTAELWRDGELIGTLGTGDCFGEINPVPTQPQRFSVIARSPMQVLTFSAFGIARFCAAIPTARERILAFLPAETP